MAREGAHPYRGRDREAEGGHIGLRDEDGCAQGRGGGRAREEGGRGGGIQRHALVLRLGPARDLLLAADYANHVAGFSAAQSVTGGNAALYHLDNTLQQTPKARSLREEIARVVQARASNSDWIAGMGRHGFRGAAEIAATLDHMAAFAQLADVVGSHLFDSFYEATLGDEHIRKFLQQNNPEACEAMKNRFEELKAAGIWVSRRNSIVTVLDGTL